MAPLTLLVAPTIWVASIVDAQKPVLWGTFVETTCVARRRWGCTSHGVWISDAGATRTEMRLDGQVDADGTVRAAFRPDALLGDSNLVHTELWLNAGVVGGGVLFLIMVAVLFGYAYIWGDLNRLYSIWVLRRQGGSRGSSALRAAPPSSADERPADQAGIGQRRQRREGQGRHQLARVTVRPDDDDRDQH